MLKLILMPNQNSSSNQNIINPTCVDCVNSDLTLDERVNLLEKNYERLNYRVQWQETLHRNVKEDGNITHYYNLVPTVIISAATGFALGLFLHKLFQRIGV